MPRLLMEQTKLHCFGYIINIKIDKTMKSGKPATELAIEGSHVDNIVTKDKLEHSSTGMSSIEEHLEKRIAYFSAAPSGVHSLPPCLAIAPTSAIRTFCNWKQRFQ
uniref:Uncharacterized protein n=1 Tax=Caenorhabditis tropicalis TaxID=1561998 RepID=A0A1I7UPP8_9PELO